MVCNYVFIKRKGPWNHLLHKSGTEASFEYIGKIVLANSLMAKGHMQNPNGFFKKSPAVLCLLVLKEEAQFSLSTTIIMPLEPIAVTTEQIVSHRKRRISQHEAGMGMAKIKAFAKLASVWLTLAQFFFSHHSIMNTSILLFWGLTPIRRRGKKNE